VSDYGLDDQAIGVRSPAGANDFSSNLRVHTGSEARPASCTVDTGGHFPGTKRGRGVTLTTHRHLVPRSRMSRNYTSSPPSATMGYSGTALLCFFVRTGFDTQTILRKLDYSNEGLCFYIWEGEWLEIMVMRSSSRNLLAHRADPQCSVEHSL
jgi:hypothetical protein